VPLTSAGGAAFGSFLQDTKPATITSKRKAAAFFEKYFTV
jgi:hypothetical protein